MSRLDQELVDRALASTRTRAKDMIEAGQVKILQRGHWVTALKPSFEVDASTQIEVQQGPATRFVSRGGLKLEAALNHVGLVVENFVVLDVGQSTGGFTDCVLQRGAARVVGIDVGHGQLNPQLAADHRVTALEGVHAKDLVAKTDGCLAKNEPQLIVVDLSFISIASIFQPMAEIAPAGCQLLALIKPQFEVGPSGLGKGGIVRDPLLYEPVERTIVQIAESAGWKKAAYFECAVEGKDGNKEFFLHAVKN